jgi:tetratricopeptide (TPR) repeat protein
MKKIHLLLFLFMTNAVLRAQSEAAIREQLNANPGSAQLNFNLAEWLKNEKKYPEAAIYYLNAARIDSTNSIVPYRLAYMYQYQVKNADSAMYYYRESGRRFTKKKENYYDNGWRALTELAGNLYNTEYFLEAYENYSLFSVPSYDLEQKYDLLKGLKNNPTADVYMKLGDELTKKLQFNEKWDDYMSRFKSGVTAYNEAIKLDPARKISVNSKLAAGTKEIAYAYFEDGYYEDALVYYEESLKYSQKDPEIYSAIGYIQLEKLKSPAYDKALGNFQKALSLTTSSITKKDMYENIGLCYERKNDAKNAIAYYEKGILQEPNYAKSIHAKLARLYNQAGNAAKAKYHQLRS